MRPNTLLFMLVLAPLMAGCAARKGAAGGGAGAAREAAGPEPWDRSANAFSVDARLESAGQSRRMKLRFYAQAPDRFRVEVRGPIGGIVLIATGREGAVRLVVPSRRVYAEGSLLDDIGSDLMGVPLTGCDFAMVLRISSGMSRFRPCEDGAQEQTPPGPSERPGMIVDTSVSGEEMARFGWDWSDEGEYPREARVELLAEEGGTSLALTAFRGLVYPKIIAEDFYWEPLPEAATKVPLGALTSREPS